MYNPNEFTNKINFVISKLNKDAEQLSSACVNVTLALETTPTSDS